MTEWGGLKMLSPVTARVKMNKNSKTCDFDTVIDRKNTGSWKWDKYMNRER